MENNAAHLSQPFIFRILKYIITATIINSLHSSLKTFKIFKMKINFKKRIKEDMAIELIIKEHIRHVNVPYISEIKPRGS